MKGIYSEDFLDFYEAKSCEEYTELSIFVIILFYQLYLCDVCDTQKYNSSTSMEITIPSLTLLHLPRACISIRNERF